MADHLDGFDAGNHSSQLMHGQQDVTMANTSHQDYTMRTTLSSSRMVRLSPTAGRGRLATLSTVPKSPQWTLRARTKGLPGSNAPGPGNYDIVDDLAVTSNTGRSPRYGFAKSSRDPLDRSAVPGPGQYGLHGESTDAVRPRSPEFGFGRGPSRGAVRKGGRPSWKEVHQPGPGSYELPQASRGPQFSLKPRHPGDRDNGAPAPTAYSPKVEAGSSSRQAVPRWGFTAAARPQPGEPGSGALGYDVPGPGTYRPSTASMKGLPKRAASYTMASRHTAPRGPHADGPGPAQYLSEYSQFV